MLRVAVSIKAGRVAPSPMEFSGGFGGLGVGVNFSHVIRNAGPRVGRPIHVFDSTADCRGGKTSERNFIGRSATALKVRMVLDAERHSAVAIWTQQRGGAIPLLR